MFYLIYFGVPSRDEQCNSIYIQNIIASKNCFFTCTYTMKEPTSAFMNG